MDHGFDVIVVGLGGMGAAAVHHLSRRGLRVLGLDAHPRLHSRGSSHGRSRLIREAYAEGAEYVPLLRRAYRLWDRLAEESGCDLLTITGGLVAGPGGGPATEGVVRSAERHGLACEVLTAGDAERRFPGFRLPADLVAVYESRAGVLDPEGCVAAHLDLAARAGAVLRHEEPVRRWWPARGGVRVETGHATYAADRLVIATGPWSAELLTELGLPLAVERVVNVHFEPSRPDLYAPGRFPVFYLVVPEGEFYGVPALPGQGVKIGRHQGGERCTPDTIRRTVDDSDVAIVRSALRNYLPYADGPVKWALTCMYTNTPDRNFIIDRHPEHPQVAFGCGFSGHGFKFAAVVGEILADLTTEGTTRHSIGFLSAARFPPPAGGLPASATAVEARGHRGRHG